MSFENLIGNDEVKSTLNNIVQLNKIMHSYMFIGPAGIGKKLFAKEFAKMILCEERELKPCNKCKSCLEFDGDNHPDLVLIEPIDGKVKIEQIRNLGQKVIEKPIISDKKVYIIDDADTMTKEASNCLLKTLEEPPEYITIILIGANESMFLNTIKSRCTKIVFNQIDDNLLKNFLKSNNKFEMLTDDMIKLFSGSIQKANSVIEKIDIYKEVEEVFSNIEKFKLVDIIGKLDCIYKNREEIYNILDYINVILLNKSIKNPKYLDYINVVEQTKKAISENSNYDMSIDNLLYEIWEE